MAALIGFLCLLSLAPSVAFSEGSALWGASGELWSTESRLPDFSFAGYHAAEAAVPDLPVRGNVKDFGAVGDGLTDDSAAFQRAIAAVSDGALFIPAGRYRLTRVLKVYGDHRVLRGEGRERTVLYFPDSLSKVAQRDHKLRPPAGSWSWSGGFLSFEGGNADKAVARIRRPARRGERVLTLSTVKGLHVGSWIRLCQVDPDGSLGWSLYGGRAPSPASLRRQRLIDFSSRIVKIYGKTLTLDRPLRIDVRLDWNPVLIPEAPTTRDVGIEELTIEFPDDRYAGHHHEPGYNAIEFSGVIDGWVRRVTIMNADNGVFLREGTKFCLIENLRLGAGPRRLGEATETGDEDSPHGLAAGHHGILITGLSQDNRVTQFRIDVPFIHDLSVENLAAGNVFDSGQALDLSLDHHRRAPYENLFTDLQTGQGRRLWECGGDESDGWPSGVRETFWNIRTSVPVPLPSWAVMANFIGLSLIEPIPSVDGVENIPPDRLQPSNLYLAQRDRRLSHQP